MAVLISQQPTQRDKTCVRMFFTQKHIILIHVRHHVSIYVCFFLYPPTAVGNHRRGCLLKQDMSVGDNANCCSGRLSTGNLQGHTPWVFFWVPVETDCVIQEKHMSESGQIFASCSCWRTRLSKPRLSPAATMSDDMPSALTPPLHCASILQPATTRQVVAFES